MLHVEHELRVIERFDDAIGPSRIETEDDLDEPSEVRGDDEVLDSVV